MAKKEEEAAVAFVNSSRSPEARTQPHEGILGRLLSLSSRLEISEGNQNTRRPQGDEMSHSHVLAKPVREFHSRSPSDLFRMSRERVLRVLETAVGMCKRSTGSETNQFRLCNDNCRRAASVRDAFEPTKRCGREKGLRSRRLGANRKPEAQTLRELNWLEHRRQTDESRRLNHRVNLPMRWRGRGEMLSLEIHQRRSSR